MVVMRELSVEGDAFERRGGVLPVRKHILQRHSNHGAVRSDEGQRRAVPTVLDARYAPVTGMP